LQPRLMQKVQRVQSHCIRSFSHFLTFAALTGTAFCLRARFTWGRRAFVPAAVVLSAVDLWMFAEPLNPLISPRLFLDPPETAKRLKSEERLGRVLTYRIEETWSLPAPGEQIFPFTPGWGFGVEPYMKCTEPLVANSAMLWGIETLTGFGITSLRSYNELMGLGGKRKTRMPYAPAPPIARLLCVTHFLSSHPMTRNRKLFVGRVGPLRLYRNERPLPRAFLLADWKRPSSRRAALEELLSDRFDPERYAIVANDIPPPDGTRVGSSDEVHIVMRRSDSVRLRCSAGGRRLAVLSAILYPGWGVWVDGVRRTPVQTDHTLRGVVVERGSHRVHWVFRPRSFKIGLGVTLWACGLLLAASVGLFVRRSGHERIVVSLPLHTIARPRRLLLAVTGCVVLILAEGVVNNWRLWQKAVWRTTLASQIAWTCDADAQDDYRARRCARALALEKVACEILPEDPAIHYRVGLYEWALGNRDAALAAWRRALDLQPDNPDARHALAQALAPVGRSNSPRIQGTPR